MGWLCGLYYADATALAVYNNLRIGSNRVFYGKAKRETSKGWFYGFKLFLVVNVFGEIIKVMFTAGNAADNNTEHMLKFFNRLQGQLFADKGFINQKNFEQLLSGGLQVITGIKSNMKNKLMGYNQKLLLKKRGMIESINDILKTVCDIEIHATVALSTPCLMYLPVFVLTLGWIDYHLASTEDTKLTFN